MSFDCQRFGKSCFLLVVELVVEPVETLSKHSCPSLSRMQCFFQDGGVVLLQLVSLAFRVVAQHSVLRNQIITSTPEIIIGHAISRKFTLNINRDAKNQ